MKKTIKFSVIFTIFSLFLAACAAAEGNDGEVRTVTLGVVGDNYPEWEYVQEQLVENEEPIQLEIVTFTDYVQPIEALESGDIDLHAALTEIYMDQMNEESGYSNTTIAYTALNPMGYFSEKHESIDTIPDGGQVAVPDDVSNESRALLLLQTAGLIEIDPEAGLLPTVDDITANPKNLEIIPMAANQTARSLQDVDIAAVNNDMATDAGLIPTEDAIFLEPVADSSEPYYNVIASRADETDNPDYQLLVDYFQTEEVAEIIDEKSSGSSIPVWEEQ